MWNLLYVDGWDFEADEAIGGRCVGAYDTLDEALSEMALFGPVAERLWGPGTLAITSPEHQLVNLGGEMMTSLAVLGDSA